MNPSCHLVILSPLISSPPHLVILSPPHRHHPSSCHPHPPHKGETHGHPSPESTELVTALAARGSMPVVLRDRRRAARTRPRPTMTSVRYYDPAEPLDLGALGAIAATVDGAPRRSAHAPRRLGPWINGGGWLTIDGGGRPALPRPGQSRRHRRRLPPRRGGDRLSTRPPLRFRLVDLHGRGRALPHLVDGQRRVAALKAMTHPYPPALKQALIDKVRLGGRLLAPDYAQAAAAAT